MCLKAYLSAAACSTSCSSCFDTTAHCTAQSCLGPGAGYRTKTPAQNQDTTGTNRATTPTIQAPSHTSHMPSPPHGPPPPPPPLYKAQDCAISATHLSEGVLECCRHLPLLLPHHSRRPRFSTIQPQRGVGRQQQVQLARCNNTQHNTANNSVFVSSVCSICVVTCEKCEKQETQNTSSNLASATCAVSQSEDVQPQRRVGRQQQMQLRRCSDMQQNPAEHSGISALVCTRCAII